MEVNVLVEHGEEYVKGIDLDGLAKFVMGEMGLPECTDVTISFVTNERIHELNRDYRGIDRPTDVLSFECDNIPFEDEELESVEEFELGDTIIATDVCEAQRQEYGTSFEDEVTLLIVHSILHLLGYDHMDEAEAEEMEALEDKIIAAWNEQRA